MNPIQTSKYMLWLYQLAWYGVLNPATVRQLIEDLT